MEDLHTLGEYYELAAQKGLLHLQNQYGGRVQPEHAGIDTKWVEVDLMCGKKVVTLEIGLPPTFPDEFPIVRVAIKSAAHLNIPHLSSWGTLCLFDTEQASPNPAKMIEVIDASIERAQKLILDGTERKNVGDFKDELESYWASTKDTPVILSLIEVATVPREKYWLRFQKSGKDQILIADSEEEGKQWLHNLGQEWSDEGNCLFLPVDSLGTPPYPTTNQGLLMRLTSHSPTSVKPLLDYLNARARPTLVVAQVGRQDPNTTGALVAWEHPSTPASRKGRKRRRSAYDELMKQWSRHQIRRFSVTRVDRLRLLVRGGTGNLPERRGAAIGCGSIGSHLSQALVHMGIGSLLLVDNERLAFDNIARHLCGASYVGKSKVEAVRDTLVHHSPHLDCSIEPTDVLNLLRQAPTRLDGYDLAVVAVARYPVERRLSQLARLGQIRSPLLFVWVEPFMAGGHAFYQPPDTPGCFQCLFDEKGEFKRQVLNSPGLYLRRESGCVSTYSPYAVLEVQRYVSDLTHFIDAILQGHISAPALFTWLGDIAAQKSAGRKIHPRWAGAEGYTAKTVLLTEPWLCQECKP